MPLELFMKIQDPNLTSLVSAGTTAGTQAARASQTNGDANSTAASSPSSSSDDVHLSELVRSLRSLASDSPERQNQIEQIARTYANGSYSVDTQATAGAIIDDATKR
jgi:flagellar biosynthesis anti-sigma factor FlgM